MAPLKVITDPSATQRKPADVQDHFEKFLFFSFLLFSANDEHRVNLKTVPNVSLVIPTKISGNALDWSCRFKSANDLDIFWILELMICLSFSSQ